MDETRHCGNCGTEMVPEDDSCHRCGQTVRESETDRASKSLDDLLELESDLATHLGFVNTNHIDYY